MLTGTKTQPPPHTNRNVIYQIPCKDCNATYCGQTRRPLHLRLSEHQRFTNNSKSFTSTDLQYTSAVAHHAHTTGHTIDFKSTHILSSLTKSSQLDLIEHAVLFSSSYFWSRHPVITLHLISFLPLSYTYHDYHPSPLSPHITQHNTSQLTHHHINTMTISHSPADDDRKNSSESSCYTYIYCYFYVFTQLYKSLK